MVVEDVAGVSTLFWKIKGIHFTSEFQAPSASSCLLLRGGGRLIRHEIQAGSDFSDFYRPTLIRKADCLT
jgi:hypothetical protein